MVDCITYIGKKPDAILLIFRFNCSLKINALRMNFLPVITCKQKCAITWLIFACCLAWARQWALMNRGNNFGDNRFQACSQVSLEQQHPSYITYLTWYCVPHNMQYADNQNNVGKCFLYSLLFKKWHHTYTWGLWWQGYLLAFPRYEAITRIDKPTLQE